MIVNEIHPFLQNLYRKRTKDQYIDNGEKVENNKNNREIVIRRIHREPGSNRFGSVGCFN